MKCFIMDILNTILDSNFLGIITSAFLGFLFWNQQKKYEIRLSLYKDIVDLLNKKLSPLLVNQVVIEHFNEYEPLKLGNPKLKEHMDFLNKMVQDLYSFEVSFLNEMSHWGMFLKKKDQFQVKFFLIEVKKLNEEINKYSSYLLSLQLGNPLGEIEFSENIKKEIKDIKIKIASKNDLISRSFLDITNNLSRNALSKFFRGRAELELENVNKNEYLDFITSNGIEKRKYKKTAFQRYLEEIKKTD